MVFVRHHRFPGRGQKLHAARSRLPKSSPRSRVVMTSTSVRGGWRQHAEVFYVGDGINLFSLGPYTVAAWQKVGGMPWCERRCPAPVLVAVFCGGAGYRMGAQEPSERPLLGTRVRRARRVASIALLFFFMWKNLLSFFARPWKAIDLGRLLHEP